MLMLTLRQSNQLQKATWSYKHYNSIVKAAMDLCFPHHHQNQRNTTSEYLVRYFSICELLLIWSEFNVQHINGSVFEFYTLFIMLRMDTRNHIMSKIKKTNIEKSWFLKIIRNQKLEAFISIKIKAENNETTLAISVDWIHEDVTIFSKMTPNCDQNCSSHNMDPRVRKESRTDMESATFD